MTKKRPQAGAPADPDRLTAGRVRPAYATDLLRRYRPGAEGAGAMGRPVPVVDGDPVLEVRDGDL